MTVYDDNSLDHQKMAACLYNAKILPEPMVCKKKHSFILENPFQHIVWKCPSNCLDVNVLTGERILTPYQILERYISF